LVVLGHGDIVLKPALYGRPDPMDEPQEGIAVVLRFAEDADTQKIEDLLELLVLVFHLLVDGVEVLGPGGDPDGEPLLFRCLVDRLLNPAKVFGAFGPFGEEMLLDLLIDLWMQMLEGEILEFRLEPRDPRRSARERRYRRIPWRSPCVWLPGDVRGCSCCAVYPRA
jgi:hypothetical protein